ncbi:MAG: hypothetical protein ACHQ9S_19300 [Candidatus Binatia bacterium]
MSDESTFRTPAEELEQLRQEIAEIKKAMREIAGRLAQIERHARRSLGIPKAGKRTDSHPDRERPADSHAPTMSREETLKAFENLTSIWRDRGAAEVENRLAQLSAPDLKLMAHELGVPFEKKPSRRGLRGGIMGRIKESVMLSRNTNVTAPRSAEGPPSTEERKD